MKKVKDCLLSSNKVNGGTPDTWVTPDSDSSCSESAAVNTSAEGKTSHRRMHRPLLVEVSAAADLLQALSLSGDTPVCGVPPIYLISLVYSDISVSVLASIYRPSI